MKIFLLINAENNELSVQENIDLLANVEYESFTEKSINFSAIKENIDLSSVKKNVNLSSVKENVNLSSMFSLIITLQDIRPLPKAESLQEKKRNTRKRSSAIYIDLPEKDALMKHKLNNPRKKKKKEQEKKGNGTKKQDNKKRKK